MRVTPGTVAYITTGAALPPGADAVIPVEQTQPSEGGKVVVLDAVPPGKWIREPGSDIAAGDVRVCVCVCEVRCELSQCLNSAHELSRLRLLTRALGIASFVNQPNPQVVLHAGTVLGAAEIGLLATVGITSVPVHGRPIVGVMSTGNELTPPSAKQVRPSDVPFAIEFRWHSVGMRCKWQEKCNCV